MTFRKILLVVAALAGLLLLYLLMWPVPIAPVAWTPPETPPLSGVYEPNTRLDAVERIGQGVGHKPEAVAIDDAGRIYGGLDDGRIMRLRADGSQPEIFAQTGGRPLGMKFDRAGNLILTDALKGLLSIGPDGSLAVLSTEAQGVPFRCPNDLDIADDGTIYFTDASAKFPLSVFRYNFLEHNADGRFLAYDPARKETRVILDHLHFANGVALSPDQSFVLVDETGEYRVLRVWLAGERKGQSEIFIDNLPGFPDNITSNRKDGFWLALVTPRNHLLDRLMPRPFMRKMVLRLPEALQPAPERYGFVLKLDTSGRVVQNLQDPKGLYFAQISSALEHEGKLYLGSIGEDAIGRLPLPATSH
jgi:sugar lactone lactonase YvrE